MTVLAFLGYAIMMGTFFYLTAVITDMTDDPWENPGPMFAGLAWPISFPFIIATALCNRSAGPSRAERRRAKELEEAEHRLRLAQIQKKENDLLDSQLRSL